MLTESVTFVKVIPEVCRFITEQMLSDCFTKAKELFVVNF
jgi:hypothetical protein